MEEYVTIRLSQNDLGKILEGLNEKMKIWTDTEEYLRFNASLRNRAVKECSDPDQAEAAAKYYQNIIDDIKSQLERD